MVDALRNLTADVDLFAYIALPLLIFLARVAEVSVNTIRIIYMLGGRRATATLLGFFEALIWLIAIRQIFQHHDNWVTYIAYPGGFAAGIYVGMILEERIAYGNVIVRIITKHTTREIADFLEANGYRFTTLKAEGPQSPETLLFVVLAREQLDFLIATLKRTLPEAFFTIENVRGTNEKGINHEEKGRLRLFTWLRGIMKN